MGINILFGMFFDGTGNNANDNNSQYSVQTSNIHDIESVRQPVERYFEVSNERTYTDSHNETSCYTNIFWLYKMYKVNLTSQSIYQQPIYIEGVGTETNQKNNIVGQALGILSTGVVAKTDRAVEYLSDWIATYGPNHGYGLWCTRYRDGGCRDQCHRRNENKPFRHLSGKNLR